MHQHIFKYSTSLTHVLRVARTFTHLQTHIPSYPIILQVHNITSPNIFLHESTHCWMSGIIQAQHAEYSQHIWKHLDGNSADSSGTIEVFNFLQEINSVCFHAVRPHDSLSTFLQFDDVNLWSSLRWGFAWEFVDVDKTLKGSLLCLPHLYVSHLPWLRLASLCKCGGQTNPDMHRWGALLEHQPTVLF